MKIFKIILTISISLTFFACSEYNQAVKGDDYQRKFELANKYFDAGEYDRTITLYEQVYQRFPKTGEGEVSYFRIGKAYYEESDFEMAGYYLGAFVQRFPYSAKCEEAFFLSAMCSVKNSPEYTLDQNDTEVAINQLQQFINKYPESKLIDTCNVIMDKMRAKLELKDYNALKLYAKTENYRAAVVAAMSFLQDYPKSKHNEDAHYLLVKNSELLYIHSVDEKKIERIENTMERYRKFVEDFPNSKHLKELHKLNDRLELTLIELKAQKTKK